VKIIGHKKQRGFLEKMANSESPPHALLFTGQESIGKKTIALDFLSSLLGGNLSRQPDFFYVEPEEPKIKFATTSKKSAIKSVSQKRQIKINQIRELNWRLSLKPVAAPLSGAVIDQAHLMTRAAQNCFLKTLEEPKGKNLLILITEHPSFLLSTIISRCENVKFYPVRNEEISDYLRAQKVSEQKTSEITEASLGRPGIAINALQNPEGLGARKKREEELAKILGQPLSLRFRYVQGLSKQKDLKETLNIWLFYFRKRLLSCKNHEALLKTKKILNAIQETILLISTTNINSRLALEILTMEF